MEAGDPIAVIRAASGTLVVAGAAGTVGLLRVPEGATVSPGEAIATIQPEGDLVAELYLPARAAGLVAPGQEVRLRFDAFPFQRFGAGRGTVAAVSEVPLMPDEVAPGLGVAEPSHRLRVTLASGAVEAYGQSVRFRAGMTLGADILLERQGVLRWLLDPLYVAGRGA